MNYTKVFATIEEVVELKQEYERARNTPMIALSVNDGLSGRDFASQARDSLIKKCHQLAIKHGLPEISGYYGCDLQTGEFISA